MVDKDIEKFDELCRLWRIDCIVGVPASELSWAFGLGVIERMIVTREEVGIAVCCGLIAAGRRPLLLMQSSGFGTCVNAIASLVMPYEFPVAIFLSVRGGEKEENSAQKQMAQVSASLFTALGLTVIEWSDCSLSDQYPQEPTIIVYRT